MISQSKVLNLIKEWNRWIVPRVKLREITRYRTRNQGCKKRAPINPLLGGTYYKHQSRIPRESVGQLRNAATFSARRMSINYPTARMYTQPVGLITWSLEREKKKRGKKGEEYTDQALYDH